MMTYDTPRSAPPCLSPNGEYAGDNPGDSAHAVGSGNPVHSPPPRRRSPSGSFNGKRILRNLAWAARLFWFTHIPVIRQVAGACRLPATPIIQGIGCATRPLQIAGNFVPVNEQRKGIFNLPASHGDSANPFDSVTLKYRRPPREAMARSFLPVVVTIQINSSCGKAARTCNVKHDGYIAIKGIASRVLSDTITVIGSF
jgi:hypothetical protein